MQPCHTSGPSHVLQGHMATWHVARGTFYVLLDCAIDKATVANQSDFCTAVSCLPGGARYLATLVDDSSKVAHVESHLEFKSEVADKVRDIIVLLENQTSKRVKSVCADRQQGVVH